MYDDTLKLKQTVRCVYLTAVRLIKQSTCFTRQLRFPIRASGSPVMDAAAATSEDGDDHLFISLSRSVVICRWDPTKQREDELTLSVSRVTRARGALSRDAIFRDFTR